MRIASVIVDIQSRAIARAFDYLVPEELQRVEVGCAVRVSFGNRPVAGYVIDVDELSNAELAARGVDEFKLKPLDSVLSSPYFDETSAKLAQWIAREYLCPLADAVHLFCPPGGSPKVKRVDGQWTLVHPGVGPIDDRWVFPVENSEYVPRANASKQRDVLEALACGGMRVAELSLELGAVNGALTALEKHGAVRIEHRRRIREAMPATAAAPQQSPVNLTKGQRDALAAINSHAADIIVCDGVTGSGKTEVYLRAISHVLAQGKTACVLVPEIALTPQTVGRFRSRFGDDVAVLHSRLSAGERFDQWDIVRSGAAHVVVGTRSALFAPLRNLGLVIIDEEHEGSYKQDSSPRYDARRVAAKLCELRDATLVLGSATPRITTLDACARSSRGERAGEASSRTWLRVELPERPSGHPLPPVTVVDMAREFSSGSRSMFSKALVDALMDVYRRHEKAVLLLNRRGFASFMLCRDCGFVPECPNCAVSLTYHERAQQLVCHHCDHTEPVPARCPHCGSPYLRKFGTGTERVEMQLREIVPEDMPIVRMDADTTKGKNGHEKLLDEFRNAEGGILLGTQMIAKGLDFPDVTLVGVINADTVLKLPDYRAAERTFQLLEQVSGRAGRAEKPGRVIVQTYWPKHPAILAAAAHDRSIFLDEELSLRDELGYPPYTRMANVLVWGKNERAVKQKAAELASAIDEKLVPAAGSARPSLAGGVVAPQCEILGPAPCVFSRLRGVYRWHILVKTPVDFDLPRLIGPALSNGKRGREDVRVAVDMDPEDLL